ncbi:MAG: hypothetical protein NC209_04305 [Alistipes sp.]|nr:hypothetical protein [Alistipes senegalensis]MCM1250349.1 hypothetical protein [Alistipes sp.]
MKSAQRFVGSGFAAVKNRLSRMRHFRGHGVHSPFVYGVVREVFMRSTLLPGDRNLFRALSEAGVCGRRAVELQNLAIHAGYDTFGLNRAEGVFRIAMRELPDAELRMLVRQAAAVGATVAVLDPCGGAERRALCRQLVEEHRSTSVDRRTYLLLFNNGLPEQHFVL